MISLAEVMLDIGNNIYILEYMLKLRQIKNLS
jgi:hypothetical protein